MSEKKDKRAEKTIVGLKREIGLLSAVNFLINVIIGTGIFATPGVILAECGSVGLMLIVWVISGVIAFMTCLPFGELSTVVPKSGSIYIYLLSAFRSFHSFFGELPAFVYFWITYAITQPCGTAISAKLFADYAYKILYLFLCDEVLEHATAVKFILGAGALVLIGVINCLSMKLYIRSQNLLTFTKVGAILFTVGCGVYMFASGEANDINPGFEGSNWSVKHITHALYLGLYAYDGGWAITGITEELKRPERNILLSIFISLTIATATYFMLNITFLTALSQQEMANGTTVFADFAEKMFGDKGGIIAAAVCCICLFANLMCSVFYNSSVVSETSVLRRMGYVAAREGHIAEFLCYIHKTWETPAPAVVVQILLSLIYFCIGGDITMLIEMGSFFMWIAYGVTMMTIFVFRKTHPDANRPFTVCWWTPILVAGVSCYLCVVTVMILPLYLFLMFLACVALSIAIYYIFIYKAFRITMFDKFQKKLQTSLQLVQPTF